MTCLSLIAMAIMAAVLLPAQAWMTNYDQRFTFSCHNNQVLNFLESIHDNGKEDRIWNFKCADMPVGDVTLSDCKWSGWVNGYDQPVSFHCPNEGVLIGIDSIHDNGPEDRIFSFMCCSPGSYITHKCALTDYVNQLDGHLEFTVPEGRVLTGVSSVHDNGKEDRRFKFDTCQLDSLEGSIVG